MNLIESSQFKQFTTLEKGQRYTILILNEMGFGNSVQFVHEASRFLSYAQHADALQLIMKPKGKRQLRQMWFYGTKEFIVWKGWVDLNTHMFGPEEKNEFATIKRSKYCSFDKRYLFDAIRSTKETPIFQSLNSHATEGSSCLL